MSKKFKFEVVQFCHFLPESFEWLVNVEKMHAKDLSLLYHHCKSQAESEKFSVKTVIGTRIQRFRTVTLATVLVTFLTNSNKKKNK